MVMSVVPALCVSTACGLAWGYRTWATAGNARSKIKASLRIVRRILTAVGPDEETILQQDMPAAAVDDLDLEVGALGDAGRPRLEFALEARPRRGVVPREAAAQGRVVEEKWRDAHAAVLEAQHHGADAVRRQREAGDVGAAGDPLPRLREVDEAKGVAVVHRPAGEVGVELGRAARWAVCAEEPVAADAAVEAADEGDPAALELAREPLPRRLAVIVAVDDDGVDADAP